MRLHSQPRWSEVRGRRRCPAAFHDGSGSACSSHCSWSRCLRRGQEIVRQWFGTAGGQLGSPMRYVGDVNADGFVDLRIATPHDGTTFPSQGCSASFRRGRIGAVDLVRRSDLRDARTRRPDRRPRQRRLRRRPRERALLRGGDAPACGSRLRLPGRTARTLLQIDGRRSAISPESSAARATSTATRCRTSPSPTAADRGHADLGRDRDHDPHAEVAAQRRGFVRCALADVGDIDGDLVHDLLVTETGCATTHRSVLRVLRQDGERDLAGVARGLRVRVHIHLSRLRHARRRDLDGDGVPDWCTAAYSWVTSATTPARPSSSREGRIAPLRRLPAEPALPVLAVLDEIRGSGRARRRRQRRRCG